MAASLSTESTPTSASVPNTLNLYFVPQVDYVDTVKESQMENCVTTV